MLSWIPLLGPILEGVSSIFSGYYNEKIQLRSADVQEARVAAQIIRDTNDDIALRILRDAALLFPVCWSALIGWDTIVAKHWPSLMFHVSDYPTNVSYIPYAALVFLFGNIGMNIWKRK